MLKTPPALRTYKGLTLNRVNYLSWSRIVHLALHGNIGPVFTQVPLVQLEAKMRYSHKHIGTHVSENIKIDLYFLWSLKNETVQVTEDKDPFSFEVNAVGANDLTIRAMISLCSWYQYGITMFNRNNSAPARYGF